MLTSLTEISTYPLAEGLPELRESVAGWCGRRFGVELDPDTEVIPTYGSKEAIFLLAQMLVDRDGDRRLVVTTEPGYPVPDRGAAFAGADVLQLPLLEENGFLPDLDAVDAATWDRAAIVWINYPNNPTGAIAPLDFLERLADLSGKHGFLLASDEAYTELWFADPPHSALEVRDRGNVAVFNTLSKRSSMTGYRSGFAAADADLIAALKQFRPSVGTAPQEFVQRASIVAWDDEEHVERTRAVYRRKRDALIPTLAAQGHPCRRQRGDDVPLARGARRVRVSEAFAAGLLEHGLIVSPGTFFGPAGEGYWRMALVPTEAECRSGGRDSRGGAVNAERVEALIAELDRGEVRVAEPVDGDWRVIPKCRRPSSSSSGYARWSRRRSGPSSTTTRFRSSTTTRGSACVSCHPRLRVTARFCRRGRDDAELRQHRSLGRSAHDGRYMGDGRFGRADRCRRPSRRRRRDRRRARAARCASGHRRGRSLRRVACDPDRRRARRSRSRDGPNVSLTSSVPVIDVTGDEPVEHRGFVPSRAIVVPGTRPKEFPAGTYQLACALIVGWRSDSTDLKVSLNDALREHGLGG